jgi:serpin B
MARSGLRRSLSAFVMTIAIAGCATTAPSAPSTPAVQPTAAPQPPATLQPTAAPSPVVTPPASPSPVAEVAMSDVPRVSVPAAEAAKAAAAINAFGLDLYRRAGKADANVVLSPTSIATALAMARAGARGETAAQMDTVLRSAGADRLADAMNALDAALAARSGTFNDPDGNPLHVALRISNAAYVQRGMQIEQAFLDVLASRFGAGARLADFAADPEAARQLINAWVKGQTESRIPELLRSGDVTSLTRFALVNAIYMKAPWLNPFEKKDTASGRFTRADGSRVSVPMMHLQSSGLGPDFPVATGAGWRAVRLPYLGSQWQNGTDELAMTIIVPDDLSTFEKGLTAAKLADLTSTKDAGGLLVGHKVNLTVPRFSIDARFDLGATLAAMGMPLAFDQQADFTGIATLPGGLFIKKVIHQANIDVDEKGTEAAAATAVLGMTGGPGDTSKPVVVTADHPFLFVVTDVPTGAVLFMGRVADPSAK